MKSLTRLSLLVVVIAMLVFGPALTAGAQGGDPLCTGLSEADCALLTGVEKAMEGVNSFRVPAWSAAFTLTSEGETITFDAKGTAEIMTPLDPTKPLEGLLFHAVIESASLTTPDGTEAGSAELLILNDMAYLKYADKWYGGAITAEDIASLGLGLGVEATAEDAQGLMETFGGDLGIDLTGVVTTARGADQSVDGATVATFTTSVDIGKLLIALLSSPLLGEALGMVEGETSEMSPEDLQMMGMFLTPMLTGTTLSLEQWVNVDSGVLAAAKIDAAINLNLAMLDPEAQAITGELHLAAQLSDLNGTFEVAPPAEYEPMDNLDTEGVLPDLGSLGM